MDQTTPGTAPSADPRQVAPAPAPEPPSILVLTRNEEVNIEACLRCLAFSDDVVVFDSYSSDRTVELARRFPNVRIVQRKFDTFGRHRNWALQNLQFRHPWLYVCDADEHITPELRAEILRVSNDPTQPHAAYRLRYKNIFLGHWLRHGGVYPVWIMRLFRPERVRYEDREVNAHPEVDGSIGELREHFIHYSFNKGLVPWFHKHNMYSQMEAHEAVRVRTRPLREPLRGLFSTDRVVRRRSVKNLSFHSRSRGLMRFLYTFIIKCGFLDGVAGFRYALMISMYEYWIELKVHERESDWARDTDAIARQMLDEPLTPGVSPEASPAAPPAAPPGAHPDGPAGHGPKPCDGPAASVQERRVQP